MNAWAGG